MALICRMYKPLRGTVNTLIMDSVLCVLKGLIGIYNKGLYDSAVVKKRVYWPPGFMDIK